MKLIFPGEQAIHTTNPPTNSVQGEHTTSFPRANTTMILQTDQHMTTFCRASPGQTHDHDPLNIHFFLNRRVITTAQSRSRKISKSEASPSSPGKNTHTHHNTRANTRVWRKDTFTKSLQNTSAVTWTRLSGRCSGLQAAYCVLLTVDDTIHRTALFRFSEGTISRRTPF